ncbi:MAG: phosphorylase family protein [Gammaproteobacteria bacterium]
MLTGIVVALPEEIGTLTHSKIATGCFHSLSPRILIACSGAGPENAFNAADRLIERGADRLVSWGCAAALDGELKPGDLAIPGELISESGRIFTPHQGWRRQIVRLLEEKRTLYSGRLSESSTVVSSHEKKSILRDRDRSGVLDMESAAVAKAAAAHGIPFVAIRAIADTASMNLPNAVSKSMNADGIVCLPNLLFHLAGNPSEIPALVRLALSFHSAKKTLRSVAARLDTIAGFKL